MAPRTFNLHAAGVLLASSFAAATAAGGGTLECKQDPVELFSPGKRPATIIRDTCDLRFDVSGANSCAAFSRPSEAAVLAQAGAIRRLAEPQRTALVVKMGVGSPFAGDRADQLNRLALELAAPVIERFQVVFLVDATAWQGKANLDPARDALPQHLAPLAVPYTLDDVKAVFPVRKLAKPGLARAMSKYYETYAWSWWWRERAAKQTPIPSRVWVAEDDVVWTGNWAALMGSLTRGVDRYETSAAFQATEAAVQPAAAADLRRRPQPGRALDLLAFREFCTPLEGWPWWHWMPEGWTNLTVPGLGLETWMTFYGASAAFMDAVAASQADDGVTGHIEYFPATLALRGGWRLAFVRHALRGRKVSVQAGCGNRGSGGMPEPKGGTFSYCCQAASTSDAENWFEGWKRLAGGAGESSDTSAQGRGANGKGCAPVTLLHPVKGDVCGRFSPAAGFGRGCWSRSTVSLLSAEGWRKAKHSSSGQKDTHYQPSWIVIDEFTLPPDASNKGMPPSSFYRDTKPLSAKEMEQRHN